MTAEHGFDLDGALARLARDEARARPAPGDALLARVLADAARVGDATAGGAADHVLSGVVVGAVSGADVGRASPLPQSRADGRRTVWRAAGFGRQAGRSAGVASALAACLVAGFLIGLEAAPTMAAGGAEAAAFEAGEFLASAADPLGAGAGLPF